MSEPKPKRGDKSSDFPEPQRYLREQVDARLDPDCIKVIRRLTRHGYTAYLVGGGVRDLLLGRTPKDFDVATSALPQDCRKLFRNCRVIGRRFRLAHIMFGRNKIIEVATFRKDPGAPEPIVQVEEDGDIMRLVPQTKDRTDDTDLLIRHDNVFGEPHEDAIRRDFTINGLFYDLETSEVIDYVGGMPDLERGVVRTIGAPDIRFREDPIRLLRAIKFGARLDLGFEPALYDAMVALRSELLRAARPRLFEEIMRLLRGGAAHRSVYLMWDTGILAEVLPELAVYLDDGDDGSTFARLMMIDEWKKDDETLSDAVLLGATLLGCIDEALEGTKDPVGDFDAFLAPLLERLVIPRRLKERLRVICLVQRRLRAGRLGSLPHREYFSDAARLLQLDLAARDEPEPDWLQDPEVLELSLAAAEDRPRRRRRRRRR